MALKSLLRVSRVCHIPRRIGTALIPLDGVGPRASAPGMHSRCGATVHPRGERIKLMDLPRRPPPQGSAGTRLDGVIDPPLPELSSPAYPRSSLSPSPHLTPRYPTLVSLCFYFFIIMISLCCFFYYGLALIRIRIYSSGKVIAGAIMRKRARMQPVEMSFPRRARTQTGSDGVGPGEQEPGRGLADGRAYVRESRRFPARGGHAPH